MLIFISQPKNAEGEVISYLALAPARRNERGNMFFIILTARFFRKPMNAGQKTIAGDHRTGFEAVERDTVYNRVAQCNFVVQSEVWELRTV